MMWRTREPDAIGGADRIAPREERSTSVATTPTILAQRMRIFYVRTTRRRGHPPGLDRRLVLGGRDRRLVPVRAVVGVGQSRRRRPLLPGCISQRDRAGPARPRVPA